MSSAVLYLAIVALWAVVLVPMWLRRDNEAARPGLSWLPHRRPTMLPEYAAAEHPATVPAGEEPANAEFATAPFGATASPVVARGTAAVPPTAEPPHRPDDDQRHTPDRERGHHVPLAHGLGRRRGRGAVMARRRRRTWGLSLLVIAVAGGAFAGLVPYWSTLPPTGLLAGHLSLLRVAARMDAARREAIAQARAAERAEAEAALAAKEAAAQAAQAEIIDLMARNRARGVFDQYADEGLRVVGD
ncbi:MAG TPA: hypothetical protein VE465_21645 [Streptosporangiaceae bacterium]|nr:hypothetical protein [Streptosporangiaceae bacterium]